MLKCYLKLLTTPLKICGLYIWKKLSTLDGNLNWHYIWQNKAVNFWQISFKGQRLIIALVLVILYCFKGTCFIFYFFSIFWKFQIYQYLGSFKFIDSFFKDMTKTMTVYFTPAFTPASIHIYDMNSTKSVYLEIRLVFA